MSDPARDPTQIERLLAIMERLRAPDGCPWDREQTPLSLRPYIIEEAHEAVEAITAGDGAEIRDELGDLLLQVVFQAQLAKEEGRFDFEQVAHAICEKLLRRHPHVFGETRAADAEEALRSWERIKAEQEGKPARKRDRHMPVLHRALRLQEKAAGFGFDWEEPEQLMEKLREETSEVAEAIGRRDRDAVKDEVGDLLFMAVNLARFFDFHPDEALEGALDKFDRRFACMQRAAEESGRKLEDLALAEQEALWQEAKRGEKKG
jgi:tetrapyrrole methylase family protein/MazG family protein